jgi:hypothetical protein
MARDRDKSSVNEISKRKVDEAAARGRFDGPDQPLVCFIRYFFSHLVRKAQLPSAMVLTS